MINQRYKLSMTPNKVMPVVRVSQFDNNSRTIYFELDDTYTGTPIISLNNSTYEATLNDNVVSFVIVESMTQEIGKFKGEVVIDRIGSLNFYLEVEGIV